MRFRPGYLLASMTVACGSTPAPAQPSTPDRTSTSPERTSAAQVPPAAHAEASPKADLSKQLGGMRLGMTADEFTATCKGALGTVARVSEIDLACSVAPEPLRADGARIGLGDRVSGKFCGPAATLCELVYTIEGDGPHRDQQTGALLAMLVSKYGPPSTTDGHPGSEPMARCRHDRSGHLERGWTFGPQQAPAHPPGWARLRFSCDLRVSEDTHSLTLSYDDENGMRYHSAQEPSRHHDNF